MFASDIGHFSGDFSHIFNSEDKSQRSAEAMSDDEYEYDYGSDADDDNYGSDGGEGGESNGVTDELIEIENAFYGKLAICITFGSLHR